MGLIYEWQTKPRPATSHDASLAGSLHLNVIFSCLEATKSYLDCFLSLSPTEYPRISIVECRRLLYGLFILYRLSTGLPNYPEWDAQTARSTTKLETYLESIRYRVQISRAAGTPAISINIADLKRADLFSVLPVILENVQNTYRRVKEGSLVATAPNGHKKPHMALFSAESEGDEPAVPKRARRGGKCPAFQFEKTPEASRGGDEEWLLHDFTYENIDAAGAEESHFWDGLLSNSELGMAFGEGATP
ncbi:hypothetical protein MMC28_009309 [Mycoblastus sanguinarius]|nr:hypothetical protein [Mycoblastus sanguinarius]